MQELSEIRNINIMLSSTRQKEECSYPICWGILKMSGVHFLPKYEPEVKKKRKIQEHKADQKQ